MGVIAFDRLDLMMTDYVLGASSVSAINPPANWTVALSTTATSTMTKNTSVWSATVSGANVNEIGSTSAQAYARQQINRDQTGSGWGSSTTDATGSTSVGKQVTFGAFSGSPNPNGANSVVVTDGTTLNAGQLYMAFDTSVTRNYANGDTEKATPTLKSA